MMPIGDPWDRSLTLQNPYPEMPNIMISEEGFLEASGPDMIPACILKDLSNVIAH